LVWCVCVCVPAVPSVPGWGQRGMLGSDSHDAVSPTWMVCGSSFWQSCSLAVCSISATRCLPSRRMRCGGHEATSELGLPASRQTRRSRRSRGQPRRGRTPVFAPTCGSGTPIRIAPSILLAYPAPQTQSALPAQRSETQPRGKTFGESSRTQLSTASETRRPGLMRVSVGPGVSFPRGPNLNGGTVLCWAMFTC